MTMFTHRNGETEPPTDPGYYWVWSLVDGQPFEHPYVNGWFGGEWYFPHDPQSSIYYGPIPEPQISTGISIPLCHSCKHYQGNNKCLAFEDIPNAIVYNEHDHRQPYPGDNGIQFESIA